MHRTSASIDAKEAKADSKSDSAQTVRPSAKGQRFDLFDMDMPTHKLEMLPKINVDEMLQQGVHAIGLDYSMPQVQTLFLLD